MRQLAAADAGHYFVALLAFFLSAQELDFPGEFDDALRPYAAEVFRGGADRPQAALFVAGAVFFFGRGGNARGRAKLVVLGF